MSIEPRTQKKGALVTGASSGIGLAISERLCAMGYEVYGLGRDFTRAPAKALIEREQNFHPMVVDLIQTSRLPEIVKQIDRQSKLEVLVNNAGVGYYGLHEQLKPAQISEMVRINLEVPMLLSGLLLRTLKQNHGSIINISSVTAEQNNPHGCAYGATKAGLSSFADSLFEEARKYGVRVTTILPDMTKTELYRHADFEQGKERESYLEPSQVAEAVAYALGQEAVIVKLMLRPQLHRIRRKSAEEFTEERNNEAFVCGYSRRK